MNELKLETAQHDVVLPIRVVPVAAEDGSQRHYEQKTERGPDIFHHLLDVNLQLFGSAEEAADHVLEKKDLEITGLSIFTCNVDHLMMMRTEPRFKAIYRKADIVTIDGAPLALLSRWTGSDAAARVTGVDLTLALASSASKRAQRVALVGGVPGRAEAAKDALLEEYPGLGAVFTASPPMGFAIGDVADQGLVRELQEFCPDIVIVCLGAPRQEFWIDAHRGSFGSCVLLGAGATIDFLSGHQRRAPRILRRVGLEAAFRLATDFRRLWRRYLVRDLRFLSLVPFVIFSYVAGRIGLRNTTQAHPVRVFDPDTGRASRLVCAACAPMVAKDSDRHLTQRQA